MSTGYQLYYGPAVRQKAAALFDECKERLARGDAESFALVVPSHRFALEMIRSLTTAVPSGWQRPPVFPIESFIARFLPSHLSFKEPLNTNDISQILRTLSMEDMGHLKPLFTTGGDPFPNMLARAGELILEMKKEGISPDDLDKISRDSHGLSLIRRLFRRYEKFLKSKGLLDQGDIYREAATHASRTARAIFPSLERLIIDGLDVFPKTLVQFLESLGCIIPETIVLVEYEPGRPLLFGHLEDSFNRLAHSAGTVHFLEAGEPTCEKEIFTNSLYKDIHAGEKAFDGGCEFLRVYELPNHSREVRFIARLIKNIATDEKNPVPLADICVCFPSLEKYASLVQEIFGEYGIPYNISLGVSLSCVPVIRAVELFLLLIESNFERATFLRVLNNPYFSFASLVPEERRPPAGTMLARLKGLRASGGIATWIVAVREEVAVLSRKLSLMERGEYEPDEKSGEISDLEILKNDYNNCQKILNVLEQLQNLADPFTGENTYEFFAERLKAALDALLLRKRLLLPEGDDADFHIYSRDVRVLEHFYETLAGVVSLHHLLGGKQCPFENFARELRVALTGDSFHPEKVRVDAVQVLGRLEPRLFSFEYLILGGFLDGEFPHVKPPSPFISKPEHMNLGLPSTGESFAADRFLFYHFIRQTRRRMIITRPANEGENPLLPSPIIHELKRLGIPILQPERDAHVYSRPEWQTAIGVKSPPPVPSCGVFIKSSRPFFSHGNFSASQLEEYARCPFQFFVRRILHLSEPVAEEPEEEITPLERGSVLHRALWRFYKERADAGRIPIVGDDEMARAAERLVALAREEMSALPYDNLFWDAERERLLGASDGEGRPGILRLFIEHERDFFERNTGYVPCFFEVAFGQVPGAPKEREKHPPATPYIIEHPDGPIRLRGRIDRIEIREDSFAIVDYKTGKSGMGMADVEEGKCLQLPVYLLSVREWLEREMGRRLRPAGAVYYCINSETLIDRDSPIILKDELKALIDHPRKRTYCETSEELEDLLERTKEHIRKYVTDIREGRFPLGESDRSCSWCAFANTCRKASLSGQPSGIQIPER
ncbi:MAG: exodeoxyribonuclease V subunit gamma [Candidatus Sumerlaeota bacterium]|nr:exodeoxyribonuclease V subunit gamma [Candidatus Sumerlaeota bacterium]